MSDSIFCKLVSPTLIEVTEVLPAGRITCSIRKGMAEAFRLDHIPSNVCEMTIPFEKIETLYYVAAQIRAQEWKDDIDE